MKQVKVKRRIPIHGSPYFQVLLDGHVQASFSFELNRPENDIYNEEKNRLAAMALAAKIENGTQEFEEIIYQSPIN